MATDRVESDGNAASTAAHEGLFSKMLSYEKQAFSDVLQGKGTLAEYAAAGLPLLTIGIATDGLGLTSLRLGGAATTALDGVATTTVNEIGLGSIGALSATGLMAARQSLNGSDGRTMSVRNFANTGSNFINHRSPLE